MAFSMVLGLWYFYIARICDDKNRGFARIDVFPRVME